MTSGLRESIPVSPPVEYSRPPRLGASMTHLAGWCGQAALQLNSIVHNLDLLARFLLLVSHVSLFRIVRAGQTYECGKTNVGAVGAAEGVAQVAAAAGACLALDGEVELVQVLRFELQGVEVLVGLVAARLVLSFEPAC